MPIRYAVAECDLGWIVIVATERGICTIEFGDSPDVLAAGLRERFPGAARVTDDPELAGWMTEVLTYLESPHTGLDLPVDVEGTAFRRLVWTALQGIPPGSTLSYGALATQLGRPKAARAVAGACASNPVAVVIPCHRVVRSDGGLGGYRWGIERKRKLLELEAQGQHR